MALSGAADKLVGEAVGTVGGHVADVADMVVGRFAA